MCVVSMVMNHYAEKWWQVPNGTLPQPATQIVQIPAPISREEFDALKRDVEEMKALLRRAKKYDEEHDQPDCEMDEKVDLVSRIARMVGVDLTDVLSR